MWFFVLIFLVVIFVVVAVVITVALLKLTATAVLQHLLPPPGRDVLILNPKKKKKDIILLILWGLHNPPVRTQMAIWRLKEILTQTTQVILEFFISPDPYPTQLTTQRELPAQIVLCHKKSCLFLLFPIHFVPPQHFVVLALVWSCKFPGEGADAAAPQPAQQLPGISALIVNRDEIKWDKRKVSQNYNENQSTHWKSRVPEGKEIVKMFNWYTREADEAAAWLESECRLKSQHLVSSKFPGCCTTNNLKKKKKRRILVSSLDEYALFHLGKKCSANHEKYYLSEM